MGISFKYLAIAAAFNKGFKITAYLASALMDMSPQIPGRHRTPHFGHIFSGEGYSAGYNGYIWSEVRASDAAEAFGELPGGFYVRKMALKLVKHLFSMRNSVDPAAAYRLFRGRDAKGEALMRDRGFPVDE